MHVLDTSVLVAAFRSRRAAAERGRIAVARSAAYALRLPGPLLERARRAAEASGSPLDQFLLAATAEKVGGGGESLAERAARADVAETRAVLDRVPDAPPEAGDER